MEVRELVERLRQGDVAAFDVAYDRYRPRIFAFLSRLAGRRDIAEDLLQETFLRLAKHARSLAPETNLSAWLFTVARNLHVSHRRALFVDVDRLLRFGLAPRDAPPTPFERAAGAEAAARIEAAIDRLPAKYREVILLSCVDGLTPAEVAAILGLSPEAARQRLSRARGMIREELDHE
jgi:RNA polymerase sigma-70 factor (ECF subfamily)